MSRTPASLWVAFERFIARQIKAGRFESKSEVIRAADALLEEHEKKVATLRRALVDAEGSASRAARHDGCAGGGAQGGRVSRADA